MAYVTNRIGWADNLSSGDLGNKLIPYGVISYDERKYAIGVDFGTESGWSVLVDVTVGREVTTAVYPFANGVIDEKLPGTDISLEPDWVLQDSQDYIDVFKNTTPRVL